MEEMMDERAINTEALEAEKAPEAETLSDLLVAACAIAAGTMPGDPAAEGVEITGAKKDLSCMGRGPQWYRMVWRSGGWMYVSSDRLPNGAYLAHERRATVYGLVYLGEVVVGHDRGGAVDSAWLVGVPDQAGGVMYSLPAPVIRRDGQMAIILPDGTTLIRPNPRARR